MPDRAEDEVIGYLGRLAGKLGLPARPDRPVHPGQPARPGQN
jgi:hypothetical protein